MIILSDIKRHLVCVPYSIENLHIMAEELGLKRCWFHKDHYDIPINRIKEFEKLSIRVTKRLITRIVRKGYMPTYLDIMEKVEMLRTVKEIIESTPNDYKLGYKVREWFSKNGKSIEKAVSKVSEELGVLTKDEIISEFVYRYRNFITSEMNKIK